MKAYELLDYKDRLAFNFLRFGQHMLGRTLGGSRPVKAVFNRLYRMNEESILKKMNGSVKSNQVPIDTVPDISPEEFLEKYFFAAKPLLIKGIAKEWRCTKVWDLEYFKRNYGGDRVILINDHIATDESVEDETTLGDIIDGIDRGMAKYARFVPILDNHPELFQDFDVEWLSKRMHRSGKAVLWGSKGEGAKVRSHLFIGKKGNKTEVHCALTNNFFVNVYGRKRWLLFSPKYNPFIYSPVNWCPGVFGTEVNPYRMEEERFKLWKYVEMYVADLEPGDVLFNPPFWWHYVENHSHNISIGLRWYNWATAMKASRTQNLLAVLATNPPMLSAIRNAVEYGKTHGKKKRRYVLND